MPLAARDAAQHAAAAASRELQRCAENMITLSLERMLRFVPENLREEAIRDAEKLIGPGDGAGADPKETV